MLIHILKLRNYQPVNSSVFHSYKFSYTQFKRSRKPGGQRVNRTATFRTVHKHGEALNRKLQWDFRSSPIFSRPVEEAVVGTDSKKQPRPREFHFLWRETCFATLSCGRKKCEFERSIAARLRGSSKTAVTFHLGGCRASPWPLSRA